MLLTDVRRALALLACAPVWGAAWAQADAPALPECTHDASVQERFIPVELFTGLPLGTGTDLVLAPVERSYAFVDATPGQPVRTLETRLQGPVKWVGEAGVEYEVYERKVPRAHERVALTPDRTALGRVYDERFGNATNEGKFPVGTWTQGQKRTYNTVYHMVRGTQHLTSSVEIEKLSCTYEGVAGALQYRWKTSRGLEYVYIYAPGRGLVQVVTYRRG